MDDDPLYQPGYFDGTVEIIEGLDPKAADFDFQLANLRSMLQITEFLTSAEKQQLRSMLHILQERSKPV